MKTEHTSAIQKLLALAKAGIGIRDLHSELALLLQHKRTAEELAAWNLRSGLLKKLCDEVILVDRYFSYYEISEGTLVFPQDSEPRDCIWQRNGKPCIKIEATVSQGAARHIMSKELLETGQSSGYLGLSDDATNEEKWAAATAEREGYTADYPLTSVANGVRRCLREKNKSEYAGMILLIEEDFLALSSDRWNAIVPELTIAAKDSPFAEVYVLGKSKTLVGLKIK